MKEAVPINFGTAFCVLERVEIIKKTKTQTPKKEKAASLKLKATSIESHII